MQKLLSVAIPCYNSQDYVSKAIESLLPGGEKVEILVVDDGSKDNTSAIAEEYIEKYPDIVRLIKKENGGHGDAVMAGLTNATGLYFRVLDSDDWLGEEALKKLLEVLEEMRDPEKAADLVITNYVYEKVHEHRHHTVDYRKNLPVGQLFGWDQVGRFSMGSYILMHAATYRTEVARNSKMVLPKHTFYVDHLFVCYPMMYVEKMYYLDVDLYHYYIGREDQSVNEKVMLSRLDQQLRVNRQMIYDMGLEEVKDQKKKDYLYYYTEVVTAATVTFLIRTKTKENEEVMHSFLNEIEEKNPDFYQWITRRPISRHPVGPIQKLPHFIVYPSVNLIYSIVRNVVQFN